jgi:excisionase family DNA binding protein
MLVLPLDADVAGHLALAIRQHRHQLARRGLAEPPELAELEQLCEGVWRGQQVSVAASLLDDCEDSQREWLTPREVARVSGLSLRTVQRRISSGELRSARVGRCRRVSRVALDEFLAV